MNSTEATPIGLCVLCLVVVAFFAVFRGKGKFKIKTKLGEPARAIVDAEDALKIYEKIEDPNATKVQTQLADWRKR